jgi:hypothetical protein
MSRQIFLLLFTLLLNIIAPPVLADNLSFMQDERIGEFRLGLSEKELKQQLHCSVKRGDDVEWGTDGLYHQTWDCYEEGISFDMVSNRKGGAKKLASITITAPSQLKTKRGIQIGSSEQAVIQAYQQEKDAEASQPKELFVAGSVYGGLTFQFDNDKVVSIFLGASAE